MMKSSHLRNVIVLSVLGLQLTAPAILAQDHHRPVISSQSEPHSATETRGLSTQGADDRPVDLAGKHILVGTQDKILPDFKLLDQHGHRLRFYSDLIKDKVVVISFFYTGCEYICLRQGNIFSRLQDEMGNRLGKEVFLISVTMDPETDTPERLKQWGQQHGVKTGWTLVTGKKEEMRRLVGHLTGDPLGKLELHSAFVYIGNDKTDNWTTAYGLDDPKALARKIAEIAR